MHKKTKDEYCNTYYEKNREKCIKKQLDYYYKHQEARQVYQRNYYKIKQLEDALTDANSKLRAIKEFIDL